MPPYVAVCALLFLGSVLLAQRIVLSLIGQESAIVLARFCGYLAAVIVLQTAVCALVAKWKGSEWRGSRLLPALFLAFNFFGLYLSYTKFAGYSPFVQVLVVAVVFAGLAVLFMRAPKPLMVGLVILSAAGNVETGWQVGRKLPVMFASSETGDWMEYFSAPFRPVQFKKKPNVYLISWDAIIPDAIAADYLDLPPGSLEYANYLKGGDFRVFRNLFIDRGARLQPNRVMDPEGYDGSLVFHNSMVILDPVLWENLGDNLQSVFQERDDSGRLLYFNGVRPSPLYGIFRDNGYNIMASYDSEYFGHSGSRIDKYLAPSGEFGHCGFTLPWYHFQGLGFCEWNSKAREAKKVRTDRHMSNLISEFVQNIQSGEPWFNFAYILGSPGHAPVPSYLHTSKHQQWFRQLFVKKSRRTAQYMHAIISSVKARDPGAIVLFIGDHGAMLARQLYDIDDLQDEEKRRFYFLDLHAVMGAIHPPDACESYLNFETEYVTTNMLIRRLIVCLSEGQDPISWEVDYASPYRDVNFNDYLYE